MVRKLLGVLFLLVGTTALAQNVTPPAGGGDFYPMKAGTKWVYKVGEVLVTVKVASSDKDGTKLDTEVNGKVVASETLNVTPEGIVRTKINNNAIAPPVMILKTAGGKVTKGDKWKVESTIQGQAVKGEFMIKDDKESVTVPLGKFDAVVVEGQDFDIAGTKTAVKYYFVAGKGIVKQSYSIQGNEAVLEVKEMTEGK
ncbi:MAG: hypothetical protein ACRC8S_10095 [Fimbriiglobus sp.]